jgi:2'-5' RNA ligase
MTVIRSFIALEIPALIQRRIGEVSAQLERRVPAHSVRWVSPSLIHLTLIFLGDVSVHNLDTLARELKTECDHHGPIEFSVGGLGAFPSASRPRVIWTGIESPPSLAALHAGLQQRLERLGYRSEERAFSPHLTLGRIHKQASPHEVHLVGQAVQAQQVGFLGTVSANEVLLMRSDLHPAGPVYSKLVSAPLIG